MNLTASIVVYKNNLPILENTINSCLKSYHDIHLYVIDNSPEDHARVLCKDSRISYIFNGRNLGFGAAHNIALREVLYTSKYHIVVNPDVYFNKEVIPEMHKFMETNPDIGLSMPKVLYPNGALQHLCKLLPKPHNLIYRRFLSFYRAFEKYDHLYEMRFTGYDQVMDVPFLSGCFMFLRTAALKNTGLFDEKIFLYTEDIDLSRRIHRSYRTVFFPEVSIYHYHEKGSYKKIHLLLYNIQSAVNYFNKWGWFIDKERDEINKKILVNYLANGRF
ncbi:glycosyltransferase family 2 protein [Fulvivirga kasyanovii]|uniref:Glycosyltransferase family 2 protein n=1 Tax=Fulvivirga kasyanovii TaxID=396812 RepID=A0ABW9RNQ2_9BACT|nr:glycosyltransferase family 2 protein [Fulvivirga kasyanovii]MTI24755.1 glycosyltransferase family 2 protein [Fulvivirga kasyanovii]